MVDCRPRRKDSRGLSPHWAAGLRSGLLAEDCGVATPESAQKRGPKSESLQEEIDFWPHGKSSQVV